MSQKTTNTKSAPKKKQVTARAEETVPAKAAHKEKEAAWSIRRTLNSSQGTDVIENVISGISKTRTNDEFISNLKFKKLEKDR